MSETATTEAGGQGWQARGEVALKAPERAGGLGASGKHTFFSIASRCSGEERFKYAILLRTAVTARPLRLASLATSPGTGEDLENIRSD